MKRITSEDFGNKFMDDIRENDILSIMWAVTRKCNLKCPYCFAEQPSNSYKFFNEKQNYKFILNNILKVYENVKIKQFYMYGGEPTLHNNCIEIFDKLYNKYPDIMCSIYSNFTASIDKYKWMLDHGVFLEISYHSNITADEYIRKIEQLNTNKFLVYILYDIHNISDCDKLIDFCDKNEIQMEVLYIRGNDKYSSDKMMYLQEVNLNKTSKNLIYESNNKLNRFGYYDMCLLNLFNFENWKCVAGRNNLFIECDGKVYPCQAYAEHKLNCIGDFSKENFILNKNEQICINKNCCHEVYIPKINLFL